MSLVQRGTKIFQAWQLFRNSVHWNSVQLEDRAIPFLRSVLSRCLRRVSRRAYIGTYSSSWIPSAFVPFGE
jgi:hypothetical protein